MNPQHVLRLNEPTPPWGMPFLYRRSTNMRITIGFQKPLYVVRPEGEAKLTKKELAKVAKDKTSTAAKATKEKTVNVTRGLATRTSTFAKGTVRKVNEAREQRALHVIEAAEARRSTTTS